MSNLTEKQLQELVNLVNPNTIVLLGLVPSVKDSFFEKFNKTIERKGGTTLATMFVLMSGKTFDSSNAFDWSKSEEGIDFWRNFNVLEQAMEVGPTLNQYVRDALAGKVEMYVPVPNRIIPEADLSLKGITHPKVYQFLAIKGLLDKVEQYYSTGEDNLADLIKEKIKNSPEMAETAHGFTLKGLFSWQDTPEGHEFWENLHKECVEEHEEIDELIHDLDREGNLASFFKESVWQAIPNVLVPQNALAGMVKGGTA